MDLRMLPTGAMTALTTSWLDEQIEQFRSIPEIAGLEQMVRNAHEQLLKVDEPDRADEARRKISAQEAEVDRQHDRLLRTIWNRLSAEIDWFETIYPKGRHKHDTLVQIRDRLLPEGLAWNLRSYLEESGNALKAVESLSDPDKALLQSIAVGEESVLDTVHRWAKAADELGDLERRKAMLTNMQVDAPNEYEARLAWMRAANAVLYMLDLTSADPLVVEIIRKPVLEAVAAANRREAARENAQAEVETEDASPA